MEEPVTFDWHGNAMLGVFHTVEDIRAPGVLYVHGLPGDRVDVRRLAVRMARRLQKRGVAMLRVDLYASGVSEGAFHQLTYNTQLLQLSFLLNAIRQRNFWLGPIILFGFSQSAKLTVAAARKHSDVAGICLWSGILTHEPFDELPQIDRIRRPQRVNGQLVLDMGLGLWINRTLLLEMQEMSICQEEMMPKIPIFSVYGSEDASTQASRAFLQKTGSQVRIIPGADHLFTDTKSELILMEETEAWITKMFCSTTTMKEE